MDFNEYLKGVAAEVANRRDGGKAARAANKLKIHEANSHDTRTARELERDRFSGIRANDMWRRFEIWILGNLHDSLTYAMFEIRPESLNELYCKVFGIEPVFEDHVLRAVAALKENKESIANKEELLKGKKL